MSETDKIFHYFNNEFPFNKEGLLEFIASFEVRRYRKGDLLLKSDQVEKQLRFLDQGFVREFYAGVDGKEMNINFYVKTGFITDFSSFTKDSKTKKYQECLSNVEVRVLPKSQFLEFLEKYQCGKLFLDSIFQRIIEKKEEEEYKHLTKTPEDLYLDLMNTKANWLQKIPQYHIASYLRVTPETLSRIRQRIS